MTYKVYNEDCLVHLKTCQDKSFDVTFTSPPYNRKRNDKYKHYNDTKTDWADFNIEVITELLRVTKGHVFYNLQSNYYNRSEVYKIIGHFNKSIVDIHIWEKTNPMPASGKNITNAVEYFLVLGESSLKSNFTYTKNILSTSVNSKMPKDHKAVMKLEVAEHFIKNFTQENDTVLDPFSGYATTGLACLKFDRNYVGIELSKEYYLKSLDILKEKENETR